MLQHCIVSVAVITLLHGSCRLAFWLIADSASCTLLHLLTGSPSEHVPGLLLLTYSHKRVPEAYATVEGACFTSRCLGGWITLAPHVRRDQMARPCVSGGWRCTSMGHQQKFFWTAGNTAKVLGQYNCTFHFHSFVCILLKNLLVYFHSKKQNLQQDRFLVWVPLLTPRAYSAFHLPACLAQLDSLSVFVDASRLQCHFLPECVSSLFFFDFQVWVLSRVSRFIHHHLPICFFTII